MKKKYFVVTLVLVGLLILSGCQVPLVKSVTKFTDANGKGERSIYVTAFVDGSCQMAKVEKAAETDPDNYYQPGISKVNPTTGITCDQTLDAFSGAHKYVSTAADGFLVVPGNAEATVQAKWEAADAYVMSLSTEAFPITKRVIQSANWSDDMMTDYTKNANATEWKAYVYELKYTWENHAEYITKTKALIGNDAWEISELKALEDAGKKWSTWTVEEKACTTGEGNCDVVTFTEHESVLYWSVYERLLSFYESDYFNPDVYVALGLPALTFDEFFSLSDVEYTLGDKDFSSDISHRDDMDENGYVNITLTAEFPVVEEAKTTSPVIYIIAGVAFVVLVAGAVVFIKRKK